MEPVVRDGYKWTEVGVIPEDWEVVSLGERLKIRHGKDQKEIIDQYGQFPILGTGGEIGRTNTPLFSKSSVLIGRKGTIDKPMYVETPFWTIDTLFYSEISERIIPRFAFYKFLTIDWYAYNEASGVPSLNARTIEGIQVALPPTLREQRAIAEALTDIDDQLAALDALIAKKRAIKDGAMQRLFTGAERLPGFDRKWETVKLGELATIKRGASPRPIADPKWFGGSVGWVRISDVTSSNIFLTKTTDYLSDEGVSQSVRVHKGELIMSIAATVGLFAIVDMDACIHDGFIAFKNMKSDIDELFLYFYLTFHSDIFSSSGQTGSQKNVNSSIVGNTEVRIPDLSEQKALTDIFRDMDAEITALKAEREKVAQLKDGMMQDLLTGKVRLV